jgi:flagellin
MALRVNNNIASLTASRYLHRTTFDLTKSLERLSSGMRINRASDDAAGMSISQKFRAQIAALSAGQRNASEATSLLQVAEGGMEQTHAMLVRLKELATQSASSNLNGNRTEINSEATQLINEINAIANSTQYNGVNLLNGYGAKTYSQEINLIESLYDFNVDGAAAGTYTVTYSSTTNVLTVSDGGVAQSLTLATGTLSYNFSTHGISFKITSGLSAAQLDTLGIALGTGSSVLNITNSGSGAVFQLGDDNQAYEKLSFTINSVTTSSLGLTSLDLSTQSGAQSALSTIDTAISTVNTARSGVGSRLNRLNYSINNLMSAIENLNASESLIRDADMATEMANFTRNQILQQSGISALAQANALPQSALALLGR